MCEDAEMQSEAELNFDACLLLGNRDPECCARPSEASCAPGFQYSAGPLCMWSHDHDYFTTECRRSDASPAPAPALPSFAEGFFLGPQGEANCTSVCEEHGMTCTVQGFRDSHSQISNYTEVAAIVAAIGDRDWLGVQLEKIKPRCLNDAGPYGYRLWPGTWGGSDIHWFNCHYWQGDVPHDHCAPQSPGASSWRRLCKCMPPTATTSTTTTSTTSSTTTTLVDAPAGYGLAGFEGMCTDDVGTAWNQGIEVGQWPRSYQENTQACAQRCDAIDGCNGFVFWNATSSNYGHCRTYAACTQLLCQGCHEYRGSTAFGRTL